MPKPFFVQRSSGLYARFLVPAKLRACIGSRFLIRPLYLPPGDVARLAAARMGVALSSVFKNIRTGEVVDKKELDELLRKASRGELFDLTLEDVRLPNGTRVAKAQIDTPQDAQMFAGLAGLNWAAPTGMAEAAALKNKRLEQVRQSSASIQACPNPPKLSEAIGAHLDDLARAKRDPKTIIESRHSLRILVGMVGDIAASALTVEHARIFLDAVEHWPKHASQKPEYKGLSVKEVVALSKKNGGETPKPRTINKHRDRLAVFVGHLHTSGVLHRDPMAGLPRMTAHSVDGEAETGRPFSNAEMQAVFGPAFAEWSAKWPHRYWGVVLGLYSGARVTEVAQLRVVDVQQIEGVWGFVVTNQAKGNKVKNQSSKRFVPLAQPVLDLGFLGYVEEVRAVGHERLFPNLPNSTGLGLGRQLSRQFSAYIKREGVEEEGMGFHAFRHYLCTHLDRAFTAKGFKPEDRDPPIGRITGHYKPPASTLRRVYVDKDGLTIPAFSEPETLRERVETLAMFVPPVALPPYTPGQFAEQLQRAVVLGKREARAAATKTKSAG